MKIIHRDKDLRDGVGGSIKMVPEEAEDLWHAYNLILVGDRVTATTVRKVQKESASGSSDSERVRMKLCIEVEAIDFDATASVLRLRGKNTTETEHVKLGAYHTLELDLQRAFTIIKDSWDSLALGRIKQASDPAANADLVVVMMQEGLAHVCSIGGSVTAVRAKIETSIPRKRGPAIAGYDKAINRFFENVFQAVLRHVDFAVVRCLILASPGFTKDQFLEYMNLEAVRKDVRPIIENKQRIIVAHASSGYKHSLKEVLTNPAVMNQIKDTKSFKEVQALEDFFGMLSSDSARAFYGPKHVEAAHERLAIQTLLITDELFRNADVRQRRRYVNLVDSVKDSGGDVHVFSSMHVSGEREYRIFFYFAHQSGSKNNRPRVEAEGTTSFLFEARLSALAKVLWLASNLFVPSFKFAPQTQAIVKSWIVQTARAHRPPVFVSMAGEEYSRLA